MLDQPCVEGGVGERVLDQPCVGGRLGGGGGVDHSLVHHITQQAFFFRSSTPRECIDSRVAQVKSPMTRRECLLLLVLLFLVFSFVVTRRKGRSIVSAFIVITWFLCFVVGNTRAAQLRRYSIGTCCVAFVCPDSPIIKCGVGGACFMPSSCTYYR